jgi:hypothetical protein
MVKDTCLLPLVARNLRIQGIESCRRVERLINNNWKQAKHIVNEKQYIK